MKLPISKPGIEIPCPMRLLKRWETAPLPELIPLGFQISG